MKNIRFTFLALLICNLSFSQEKRTDSIKKSNIKKVDTTSTILKTSLFKMHPNPAKDKLFILGTNRIKSIELINILGKQVATYHFNKSIIKIDVSELKKDIYIIKVIDENDKVETKRLVIE
ncbi:hypothetical protein BFR04_04525 [Gaetbulibacter sp. 4G1]|nr:T9SS type A sorting domain-containing protein [Gaetbulibacter sp. 4G1]PIA78804.1 hypothetical protein BFR04_04525 [Gaetbulibacter sp. 4G1]